MNIKKQLEQYKVAQDAAEKTRLDVIKRLDIAAEIIKNIQRKQNQNGYEVPSSEFEWIPYYNKADAQINIIEREGKPFQVQVKYTLRSTVSVGGARPVVQDKVWNINPIFIFGSTWDIAHEARRIIYHTRYLRYAGERDVLKPKITNSNAALARETAKIWRDAKEAVKALENKTEKDLAKDKDTLVLREQQLANLDKHFAKPHETRRQRKVRISERINRVAENDALGVDNVASDELPESAVKVLEDINA